MLANQRKSLYRHKRVYVTTNTSKTVIPYFKKFTKKYKTLESLSKANETQILKMGKVWVTIEGLEIASAKLLVKEHNLSFQII